MPACRNCGAFVSREYVRVLVPEELTEPRVCPHCEDRVRSGGQVREARAARR